MIIPIIIALAAASTLAPAPAGTCRTFMIGNWAGKGVVRGFGSPIRVDNVATYAPDKTFKTRNRYRGDDGKWHEQSVAGSWTAAPGAKARQCRLVMKSGGNGFEASSTSDILVVNADTYRSLGFDMKRVRDKALNQR